MENDTHSNLSNQENKCPIHQEQDGGIGVNQASSSGKCPVMHGGNTSTKST